MSAYIHAFQLRWQNWRETLGIRADEWKKFFWLIVAFCSFYFFADHFR